MNDENLTLEELYDPARRRRELDEVMRQSMIEYKLREAEWQKQRRHQMLMFPIQLVFFPVMLLVKLFKWTYDYKD